MSKEITLVCCFNCPATIPKNEAFYIKDYDTYLCPKCYLALLEGKPIRLNNWRRRGV